MVGAICSNCAELGQDGLLVDALIVVMTVNTMLREEG